jgi:hypothetical protein
MFFLAFELVSSGCKTGVEKCCSFSFLCFLPVATIVNVVPILDARRTHVEHHHHSAQRVRTSDPRDGMLISVNPLQVSFCLHTNTTCESGENIKAVFVYQLL